MEEILNKYKSKLINKIKLQGIYNKTDEQILLQNFKYFDKSSSGYCNFDNFIKINQKLNIIIPPQELQKIFFYYDANNEEIINYNEFIHDIFNTNNKSNNNTININNDTENISLNISNSELTNKNIKINSPYKKPFFENIINYLIKNELGPGVSLLILYQGFILGEKNFEDKLTLNEFVKIVNDNLLFQHYVHYYQSIQNKFCIAD